MAAGVFGGEPVDVLKMELIDGELLEKMTTNPPHWTAVMLTQEALRQAFPSEHVVTAQTPLYIDEYNEPEPDVMVLTGAIRDYLTHPRAEQTRLVVEVADTSHSHDRNRKARLYARAGVTDYWVLVLSRRVLEVRRDPAELPDAPGTFQYQTLLTIREDSVVTPLHAPETSIRVTDLLPREA